MAAPNSAVSLFPPSFLKPSNIPDSTLIVRPLALGDYEKGHCQILSQLTEVGPVTKEQWEERFMYMKLHNDTYFVIVIEDTKKQKLIGSGTVAIEKKFIRNCGQTGHIEDIVVDKTYRGKNLGKEIIDQLTHVGFLVGCYKIILDCSDDNVPFYTKCGYTKKEVQMVLYKKNWEAGSLSKL
eukprot:TRINITY_DN3975_c0_g1_i2.p1 TRINITY_DN3975_c0_g1~~TRINITY_DN3975_c0_g1_i2.p1  ORF type:complete len:181 (-),score=62.08 TRINITY_DN3975_c0_g1_i2:360-902(-)